MLGRWARWPSLWCGLTPSCWRRAPHSDALERAYIAVPGDFWPDTPEERAAEAERERISAAQDPLVERMCELRAVTREGQVARPRSLALWDAEIFKKSEPCYANESITAAIVPDLIGEAET